MNADALNIQILRLIKVRKKISDGEYLTKREEDDVSMILGIKKFKDRKEIETKIDEFFAWVGEILKTK